MIGINPGGIVGLLGSTVYDCVHVAYVLHSRLRLGTATELHNVLRGHNCLTVKENN